MIGTLISIIVTLIIIGVLFWAVRTVVAVLPMGEPFKTILNVLLIVLSVIVSLWLCLQMLNLIGIGGIVLFHQHF